jgi:hypothetical protein
LTLWPAILPSDRPFVSLRVQVAGGQKSSQIRLEIQPFRTQIRPRINSPFSYPVPAERQASILEPRSGRPSIPEPISRRKPTLVAIPLLCPRRLFSVLADESGFNRIYRSGFHWAGLTGHQNPRTGRISLSFSTIWVSTRSSWSAMNGG